jgi:ketol-acid reductoisomerase
MYSQADVDTSCLSDRQVTILGYGSQGRAHALNLKDSGFNVVVGLRPGGPSWAAAEADGLTVRAPNDAVKGATIVAFLTPDMVQKSLYLSVIDDIDIGAALLFAHGFAVHFRQVEPREDLDTVLIAPKGPGGLVRRQYEEGHGVPCLVAVHQDSSGNALQLALAYSAGIGGARAGVIETTFAEETETDLFGEQAVLCGGTTELIVAGFETLVEAGYQPEVAYYEVMHELVVNQTSRDAMKAVLTDIQDGTFARNWIAESEAGMPEFKSKMNADLEHPIEKVGADLRSRMDWLQE